MPIHVAVALFKIAAAIIGIAVDGGVLVSRLFWFMKCHNDLLRLDVRVVFLF